VLVLAIAKGTWAVKPEKGQRVYYLSDLPEFGVKVAEKRFGKKGNPGFGAGNSFRIRVKEKESPKGLSMVPAGDTHAAVKYTLEKLMVKPSLLPSL
jgi:hypothetical protein